MKNKTFAKFQHRMNTVYKSDSVRSWTYDFLYYTGMIMVSLLVTVATQILLTKGVPALLGRVDLPTSPTAYIFRLAHPLAVILAFWSCYLMKRNGTFRTRGYYTYVAGLAFGTMVSLWLLSGMVGKTHLMARVPGTLYQLGVTWIDRLTAMIA